MMPATVTHFNCDENFHEAGTDHPLVACLRHYSARPRGDRPITREASHRPVEQDRSEGDIDMTIRTITLAATLAVLTGTSSMAATVTLNVVGGQLRGASNVDVNGTLFDVEFVDGTCAAIFDGCEGLSDFDFPTLDLAEAAAISLGDTVFVDGPLGDFDSDPALTFGIEPNFAGVGIIVVPLALPAFLGTVQTVVFLNTGGLDGPSRSSMGVNVDLSNADGSTFARFTPSLIPAVPLPASGFLLLAAIAGFGALGSRRNRGTAR